MKPLTKKERAELKKLMRKIRSSRATVRELHRAFALTNRDHAEVKGTARAALDHLNSIERCSCDDCRSYKS